MRWQAGRGGSTLVTRQRPERGGQSSHRRCAKLVETFLVRFLYLRALSDAGVRRRGWGGSNGPLNLAQQATGELWPVFTQRCLHRHGKLCVSLQADEGSTCEWADCLDSTSELTSHKTLTRQPKTADYTSPRYMIKVEVWSRTPVTNELEHYDHVIVRLCGAREISTRELRSKPSSHSNSNNYEMK